jgi:hypothetical protein
MQLKRGEQKRRLKISLLLYYDTSERSNSEADDREWLNKHIISTTAVMS